MRIGKVVGQDFKSWKGKASMVLLVSGCNMCCPFCYTPELVKHSSAQTEWKPTFEKVKRAINGVIVTGGEPLVQDHLSIFCKKMKLSGFSVRVETNGSKPQLLNELLTRKVIDSIALDVKAPFKDYAAITKSDVNPVHVRESIGILKNRGVEYELRTTWTPDLTEEQVLETAKQCSGSTWVLQAFEPGNCLEPSYNAKPSTPYDLLRSTAAKAEGPSEVRIRTERGEEKVK